MAPWLFGRENAPNEYALQIIIDSGKSAAEWEHIGRQMTNMARQGGTRGSAMKFLKAMGIGGSAAGTLLKYAWGGIEQAARGAREGNMRRKAEAPPGPERPRNFVRDDDLPGLEMWDEIGEEDPFPAEDMEDDDDAWLIGDNADATNRRFIREFDTASAMEVDEGGQELVAARAAGGGGPGGPVSKETPISPYPSLSYGLQETHTTILPYRTYFSFANLTHTAPLQVKLRLNSIFDMFTTSMVTLAASSTAAAKGPYILPLGPGSSSGATATFPVVNAAGAGADERPQWRDFYCRLYDYYTVLGCKYKITIMNSSNVRGGDAEVAVNFDTYSDTAGTAGNIMPAAPYHQVKAFKNIQWYICAAETSENSGNMTPTIISGKYRPGQAHRNIENDGDVKTWTSTNLSNVTLPTLKELLTLNFFKAGLAYSEPQHVCGNVCVELDYIVQFKDLKEQARYPNSVTTDQDILLNIDESAADDVRMGQST